MSFSKELLNPPKDIHINKINLKIGDYEVYAIPTGIFGLDGGAMFGTVPKVLWQKSNPANQENQIPMEARALLLKSKDKTILIDTGNGSDFIAKYGEKLGSKFAQMYGVDESGPSLMQSLKQLQLTANDITDVILTHLHFDHCGGSTCANEKNEIVPAFKNARYYIQKQNLLTARNPNVREKASYLAPNFEPLVQAQKVVELDGPVQNFLPGISAYVSNGHTEGHQAIIISDNTTQLIYCGDVIPTSSHIRSAWVMGYDLSPLQIIKEKSELLQKSLTQTTYYFFEHDPYCDLATVEPDKNEFKVKERFQLSCSKH